VVGLLVLYRWLGGHVVLAYVLSHPLEPVVASYWLSNMPHHLPRGGNHLTSQLFAVTFNTPVHHLPTTAWVVGRGGSVKEMVGGGLV